MSYSRRSFFRKTFAGALTAAAASIGWFPTKMPWEDDGFVVETFVDVFHTEPGFDYEIDWLRIVQYVDSDRPAIGTIRYRRTRSPEAETFVWSQRLSDLSGEIKVDWIKLA